MKSIKIIFTLFILFTFSISILGCKDEANAEYANAYITIDINPSIEIITNDEGLVEEVSALNYDAEVLLVDTDFSGKTVDEAVDIIMELALETGYIIEDVENAIIVTTEVDDEDSTNDLNNAINKVINRFIKRHRLKMEIYHEDHMAPQEMKELAEELNISIGKLKLINKVIELDDELTLEEAANMSVKDLNQIIINNRKELNIYGYWFRKQYINFKSNMKYLIEFRRIELIYELMMEEDEDFFATLLINNNTSVEDIKNLYKEYYEELKTIIDLYNEERLINEIKNNEELQNLIEQKQYLNQEMVNLFNQLKANKNDETIFEQLNNKLREIEEIDTQIRSLIREQIELKIKERENYEFEYNDEDEFNLSIRLELKESLIEIREKYEELFSELNINLDELESLFEDDIVEELQQIQEEAKSRIKNMKENAKDEITEYLNRKKIVNGIKIALRNRFFNGK